MFKRNSLSSILSVFNKISNRLEAFITESTTQISTTESRIEELHAEANGLAIQVGEAANALKNIKKITAQ